MELEWATRVNDPLASVYSPVSWRPALVSSLHARRKMRKARTEGGGRRHVSDADVCTHAHTPKTSDQRSRESWDDASCATQPAFQQQEHGSKLAIYNCTPSYMVFTENLSERVCLQITLKFLAQKSLKECLLQKIFEHFGLKQIFTFMNFTYPTSFAR